MATSTAPTFSQLLGEIKGTTSLTPQLFGGDPGGSPTGPVFSGGIPTGGTPTGGTTTTTTTTSAPSSWLNSILNYFTGSSGTGCGIGDFFLRIALFVLGFIAVIGAIYLYKGSNPVLQIPARIARAGTKALTEE
jgi:hypothetical protein